jgi:hypothetical protein
MVVNRRFLLSVWKDGKENLLAKFCRFMLKAERVSNERERTRSHRPRIVTGSLSVVILSFSTCMVTVTGML